MNSQYAFLAPLVAWFIIFFATILIDMTFDKMRNPKGKPFAMTFELMPCLALLLISAIAGSAYMYYN